MDKDIVRILSTCKVINLKENEPFPKPENEDDPIYVVGLSNANWGKDYYKCDSFYKIKYRSTDGTWGGYTSINKDGDYQWYWTMNDVFGDENNREYAYIVNNYDDGRKLAKFLDTINGYFDINHLNEIISRKQEKIKKLQEECNYYLDIIKYFSKND